jgi:hypothetical protein
VLAPTQNPRYTRIQGDVGQVAMPNTGDELHHFGWNAAQIRTARISCARA